MRVRKGLMRLLGISLLLCLLATAAQARVVVVGIDGGSWNVLDPLIEAGELPNLAAIARAGVTAELETVEPVTSPVVWTSIATGRTPEHHGITDFFSTAVDVEVPTVFERLSAQGLRVGLYDYLMTWPPVTLENGFVMPGWLRRDDTVTPGDVWARVPFEPWLNAYDPLKTNDDYRRNGLQEVASKAARWNALSSEFDLDVGAVTFYAVDGMSHRFWHGAYPDQFAPEIAALATPAERTALVDALRGVDAQLGEIRAALSPDDTILIVSDHGFHGKEDARDVWVSHVGEAVVRAGLDPERDGFGIVTEFGQLVVRVAPRTFEQANHTTERLADLIESHRAPDGSGLFWAAEIVDIAPRPPGHERGILNRLRQWAVKTALAVLFDVEIDASAHAVILAVPRGGALSELAPDTVVAVGEDERPLDQVFSRQLFTGDHDPTAIFLAAGGPIVAAPDRGRISVLDIAPLIFHLSGSAIPDDLEGSLPEDWIDPADLRRRPARKVPAPEMPGIDRVAPGANPSDPALLEKLRRLGYIE